MGLLGRLLFWRTEAGAHARMFLQVMHVANAATLCLSGAPYIEDKCGKMRRQ